MKLRKRITLPYLAVAVLVEEEGHEALAGLLLPVGVDPHEPVGLSVLRPDAEHSRLQLLAVLHVSLRRRGISTNP